LRHASTTADALPTSVWMRMYALTATAASSGGVEESYDLSLSAGHSRPVPLGESYPGER
jgi:hypothetical protein